MSVYKPKTSSYYLYDFQLEGDRFHGSTRETEKRKAIEVEKVEKKKVKAAIKAAKAARGGPLTIDDAAERYYLEVGEHHANADTTVTDLERIVAYFGPTTLLTDINDDKVAELVLWRRQQPRWGKKQRKDGDAMGAVSPSTVNRSTTLVLKKLFTRAKKAWRYVLPDEPDWRQHFLAEPKEIVRELRTDESSALELATRADYEPIFSFERATGVRLAECLIRWSDVDFDEGWIVRPGKGGRIIRTAITPTVRDILLPLIGHNDEWVFTYQADRSVHNKRSGDRIKGERYPITYSGLKSQWKRTRSRAGVKGFRFHDFRHDLGTKLLRMTGDLKKAQKALNHADIKTTTRYAHVLDEEVAASLEKLSKSQAKRNKSRKISQNSSGDKG